MLDYDPLEVPDQDKICENCKFYDYEHPILAPRYYRNEQTDRVELIGYTKFCACMATAVEADTTSDSKITTPTSCVLMAGNACCANYDGQFKASEEYFEDKREAAAQAEDEARALAATQAAQAEYYNEMHRQGRANAAAI